MNNFEKLVINLFILILLSSCGTIKEGFSSQKKDNTDEFLVEKKNPLKLPPNFEELPVPKSDNDLGANQKDQEIKSLLTSSENNSDSVENNTDSKSKNLQKLLLDKIKSN